MNGRAVKIIRRQHAREAIGAALGNEELTRRRVEILEKWFDKADDDLAKLLFSVGGLVAIGERSLWGRLRWLLTGR